MSHTQFQRKFDGKGVPGAPVFLVSMFALGRMLEINSYETVRTRGHKVRKAMADGDATHKPAGLIEMDDSSFGASKSGKRGLRALGKVKRTAPHEAPTVLPWVDRLVPV